MGLWCLRRTHSATLLGIVLAISKKFANYSCKSLVLMFPFVEYMKLYHENAGIMMLAASGEMGSRSSTESITFTRASTL